MHCAAVNPIVLGNMWPAPDSLSFDGDQLMDRVGGGTCWFNVDKALAHPTTLDKFSDPARHREQVGIVEESSACWQISTRILIGGGADEEDPVEVAAISGARLPPEADL